MSGVGRGELKIEKIRRKKLILFYASFLCDPYYSKDIALKNIEKHDLNDYFFIMFKSMF